MKYITRIFAISLINTAFMSNELSIGNKIIILRKDKNWSQVELAKQINASREIISRYERNESQPSLEMIIKMANAFGVTIDFLTGQSENASFDKETVERINNIQKMDGNTKSVLFNVIDTYIQNFKTKQAFAK
jgi:transcriptional regulator with XRE-family HTH domain